MLWIKPMNWFENLSIQHFFRKKEEFLSKRKIFDLENLPNVFKAIWLNFNRVFIIDSIPIHFNNFFNWKGMKISKRNNQQQQQRQQWMKPILGFNFDGSMSSFVFSKWSEKERNVISSSIQSSSFEVFSSEKAKSSSFNFDDFSPWENEFVFRSLLYLNKWFYWFYFLF